MRAHQADYPVTTQCRVLEVPTSGYYAWLDRKPSKRAREDAALSTRIRELHRLSQGTYGSPRLLDDLAEEGLAVSRKRVARMMIELGLQGVSRRRFVCTTTRSSKASAAPDLVRREFSADGPNKLWVADITYVPTWSGFLYLAVVLDAWSRRIVGWAMRTHLRTELVAEALEMALARRKPEDVIHHSDQGCSTPRSNSEDAVARRMSGLRWGRSATASTTSCARTSLPRSSASCSIGRRFEPRPRLECRSFPLSKASTTPAAGTRRSGTSARCASKLVTPTRSQPPSSTARRVSVGTKN